MSPWVALVVAVLIAANALYVAAEFSGVGVRRSRVRRLSADGHWLARRLLPHVQNAVALDRYVGASQIGITISSLMLGAYAQATMSATFVPLLVSTFDLTPVTALSVSALTVLIVLTALQLVLGELVPKALALQYPTETALATVLPMQWTLVVFSPVISLLNGSALFVLRLIGAGDQTHSHLHSPEEIDLLIAESRDGGLLEPLEQQRLRRALRLGQRLARDLMVPRDRLTMLEVAASWDAIMRTVAGNPYSRIPIYERTPERVIGVLRVKDLVERYAAEGPVTLARLIRPMLQLPDDLAADRALAALREHRAHAAVLVNHTGVAVGLLTIQDVLGELLGLASGRPTVGRPSTEREVRS
ncbi:MAG: hemolysin family protein [Vicinamibacterales bacterium]